MNKIFLLCVLCCPAFLISQESSFPAPEQYKELKYRCIGPFRGGRVTTVTGIPDQPYTFFMGSTGGGVWKTEDGGTHWENITDGYLKVGSVGAVEVAPSDPNILYVGTGSGSPRGNISPGNGVYRSQDGGNTWEHVGLDDVGLIGKIVVHPQDPNQVYVAALGNIFGPNSERGVFRSTDGGTTWKNVHYLSDSTGCSDIVMDPHNPRILYAGFWRAERKPWTLIDGAEEGGVYKSVDGGDSWKQLKGGLAEGVAGRVGIAVSPANPLRVWVIREAEEESDGGLFRSEDGGKTWKRINREHKLRQRAWYYSRVFADPVDEHTVYVLNTRMYKSVDGGKTFETIPTPHGDNHCLWVNPNNPDIMIESNDGGANVSYNGGRSWSTQFNQPTSELYRVSVDNQFPYRVYGAQQDNSTISVPSESQGGITPLQDWFAVGGGESGHIAVDPKDPNLIYAGNYIGQIDRTDRSKGHSRNVVAYPQMHDGVAPRDIRYRFQWNAPIRISPHDPKILYHCSQHVHKSADGGQSWELISPDLTTNQDAYQNIPGGPVQHDHTGVELYTTIFAFEESPQQKGLLWAGTDDGRIHLSRNGGEEWEEITPKNMPKEGTVNTIELSAHDPGRAFMAVYKYRENDFRPYIFRTDNFGKSWKLLTDGSNGIPANHWVRVVREDPERKGLLYAGTEFGIYLSLDDGKSWQSFQQNLPHTPITDMLIYRDDLVLATQGRSFWILDDLTALRSLVALDKEEKAALFPISSTYRTQIRGFRGKDSPKNAPNGALIHFYLQEKPQETQIVKLQIEDSEGKVIATYATDPDSEKEEKKLMVNKGLNRFVWNLRYPKPDVISSAQFSLANTSGAKAPPGSYLVRFSAPGYELAQELLIQKDPRWTHISDEDLREQFSLSQEVGETLSACHKTIRDLRSVRKQISQEGSQAVKSGFDISLKRQAQAIVTKLDALEEELIQIRSESGQDPINYPPKLDDQIAYLYSTVNGQDARPTQGCYERFEDLKKILSVYTDQFTQILDEDVTAFTQALEEAGVPRILPGER
ncbi:MAG: glycosyl hydrolase [Bacteroidota bacterium]